MSDIKATGQAQARLDREAALKRAQVAATAGTEHAQKTSKPGDWTDGLQYVVDQAQATWNDTFRDAKAERVTIEDIQVEGATPDVDDCLHTQQPATDFVREHAGEVARARASLSEGQRQQYDRIMQALAANGPQDTLLQKGMAVTAQAALQSLLLKGKLDALLLKELDTIKDYPLCADFEHGENDTPPTDRSTLLREVVCDLNTPVEICQKNKGTCVPATAQMLLAAQKPVEYVRTIASLASRSGQISIGHGAYTLARVATWKDSNDHGRSLTGRLCQPAAMQAVDKSYSNHDDIRGNGTIGLSADEKDAFFGALMGLTYRFVPGGSSNASHAVIAAREAIAKGLGPIPIGMNYVGKGADPTKEHGHALLLEKVENGRAYVWNPQNGERESMPLDKFTDHLRHVSLPSA
jgi:hypothetical protein